MNYNIIASGSSGNATIVNNNILIDCGVPFSTIKQYYKDLKLVFITHKHTDHLYKPTIKKLGQLRPNLKFVVGSYLAQELYDLHITPRNIVILDLEKWYQFMGIKCKLDYIPHDVENVAIHLDINDEKLFYATDTNDLSNVECKNYDIYLIEGNYDEEEIEKREQEKFEKGEFSIEGRIKNSHLSKNQCIQYFMSNCKARFNIGDNAPTR